MICTFDILIIIMVVTICLKLLFNIQENNAIATVDINAGVVTEIYALGTKPWDDSNLDPSDRDNGMFIFITLAVNL